jgi:formylglycine-generating enzyme required for sulfatase activity
VKPPGPPSGIFTSHFTVAEPGRTYLIEVSTNLLDWRIAERGRATGDRLLVEDFAAWLPERLFYRARPAPEPLPVRPGSTNEMAWIPPGTFTMGAMATEPGFQPSDGPPTRVTLTRGYWIGRREVTQAEYTQVVGDNPSPEQDPTMPVFGLNWNDANAYCEALTAMARDQGWIDADKEYRLPTEAEWEHACRAGTDTIYYWGDDPAGAYLHEWFSETGYGRIRAVGLKLPNPWGLHDMYGNVSEWCLDYWRPRHPGGELTDPGGLDRGTRRVVRGGDVVSLPTWARSATRMPRSPQDVGPTGFRVVLADDE